MQTPATFRSSLTLSTEHELTKIGGLLGISRTEKMQATQAPLL